jgi:hypothetical protein
VLDTEQLRDMTPEERRRLLRSLVDMECPDPVVNPHGSRRRAIALVAIVVCCIVLAAWIGVLAVTLPRYYRSGGWRGAWVGFDIVELAAFLATGWAAWKRRQVLIICLIVLATLLCCDAWFDVVLDARTSGFWVSLLSALLIELPLAAFAALGARRLLRLNIAAIRRYEGIPGPIPRLRDVELIGGRPDWKLSDHLLAEPETAVVVGADGAVGEPRHDEHAAAGQAAAGPARRPGRSPDGSRDGPAG